MATRHSASHRTLASVILLAAIAGGSVALDVSVLKQDAAECQSWLVETRRALHSKPELMYEEYETSEYIRKALDKMNIKYR